MQTTRALLCLGNWSRLGFIRAEDVRTVVSLAEEEQEECDDNVAEGWDSLIDLD